jgi:hypothetical protein
MSILREWRGVIRRSERDAYVDYIRHTGLDDYRATPGNLGAAIAVRDLDEQRTEVVTLSWWESIDSIRAFAGDDIELARYYPEDDRTSFGICKASNSKNGSLNGTDSTARSKLAAHNS